jgi:hypothetical protein
MKMYWGLYCVRVCMCVYIYIIAIFWDKSLFYTHKTTENSILFFKNNFNNILPYMFMSPRGFFPSVSATKILSAFLMSSMSATAPPPSPFYPPSAKD